MEYLEQFCEALSEPETILVRTQRYGKWDSYPLTELSAEEAIYFIKTWLEQKRIPVRLKK